METPQVLQCRNKDGKFISFPKEKISSRASAYGVIIKDEKVLLCPCWGDGFDFPGGKIEIGETIDQALTREIREETGLSVTPGKLLHAMSDMYVHERCPDNPWHTILLYYTCTNPRGTISKEGLEASEDYMDTAQWVPLGDVEKCKFYNPVDSVAMIQWAMEKGKDA